MDYPINFADQLAQHLKAFRQDRGLTQAQLALQLGLAQSRIADIETNPAKVSLENLFKVLTALDVRVVLREGVANPASESVPTSAVGAPKTLAELKSLQGSSMPNEGGW
jgi:HTH-type transcriptional regulator / antitoxin HipB